MSIATLTYYFIPFAELTWQKWLGADLFWPSRNNVTLAPFFS